MEIPMTTDVGNGRSSSSGVKEMPDRSHPRVGSNGVLSRFCRDVASHDVVVVFLSCRHCQPWSDSRGTCAGRTEGSRPGASQPAGRSRRRRQEEERPRAEGGAETEAESVRRSGCPPAKRRRLYLPAVMILFLLTLVACRPCHGHDPELFDMDDEDGKFYISR